VGFSKFWLKDVGKVHWAWIHEHLGNQLQIVRVVVTGQGTQTLGP